MEAEAQALRAYLNMVLLAVLAAGPLHGYGVIVALRDSSGGRFTLTASTVYPALHRLEHFGLITSTWTLDGGRHRRAYRLTPAGEDKLSTERRAWLDFVAAVGVLLEPRLTAQAP